MYAIVHTLAARPHGRCEQRSRLPGVTRCQLRRLLDGRVSVADANRIAVCNPRCHSVHSRRRGIEMTCVEGEAPRAFSPWRSFRGQASVGPAATGGAAAESGQDRIRFDQRGGEDARRSPRWSPPINPRRFAAKRGAAHLRAEAERWPPQPSNRATRTRQRTTAGRDPAA